MIKKKWITIILISAGVLAGILTIQYVFRSPSFDKQMEAMANELNKDCPLMIDSETRLDDAVVLPNNVFRYNYTLVKLLKKDLDIKDLKSTLEPNINKVVKTEPALKFLRDHHVTFEYYYRDRSGDFLFKISVSPEAYEQ
jgi:hypothetical protein